MTTPQSIIVDTDFHRLADDHEALRMLAAWQGRGSAQLTGITTVTGNAWANVCAVHARRAVDFLALEGLEVYAGANSPLLHRRSDFAHRSRLYGAAFGGAWGHSRLLGTTQDEETEPAETSADHAVEFIVSALRSSAHRQSLLAIGPLTNLALALRIAPDLTARIDRLVTMGGALYVPGNVTPSAEFNWWFDAEAAAIVLEEDIALEVVPLDATDSIRFDYERFLRWKKRYGQHAFFRAFHEEKFSHIFDADKNFSLPIWDAVTAACLIDPSMIRRSEQLWLSVDCSDGPSYGRVIAYGNPRHFKLERPRRRCARVVLEVDPEAFWNLYESLVFEEGPDAS